jgi:DNA-binding TFAR19-related protein (PDSD5 family)
MAQEIRRKEEIQIKKSKSPAKKHSAKGSKKRKGRRSKRKGRSQQWRKILAMPVLERLAWVRGLFLRHMAEDILGIVFSYFRFAQYNDAVHHFYCSSTYRLPTVVHNILELFKIK